MPRLPVDGKRVIEHRITFGTKERELLDNVATSYSINKVATPLVALISDISALAFLTSIYIGFKFGRPALNKLKDTYESTEELMKDVANIIEESDIIDFGLGAYEGAKTLEEKGLNPLEVLFSNTPLAPLFKVF
jgi:hypothetical protein